MHGPCAVVGKMAQDELEAVMQSIIASHQTATPPETDEAWWIDTRRTSSLFDLPRSNSDDSARFEQFDEEAGLCHSVRQYPETRRRIVTLHAFIQEEMNEVPAPGLAAVSAPSTLWTWLPPRTKHGRRTTLSAWRPPDRKNRIDFLSCFRSRESMVSITDQHS